MKSFVGITMLFTQSFYLLHLAIVFFCSGKKLEQPCLEQFICLAGFFEKFPALFPLDGDGRRRHHSKEYMEVVVG